MSEYIIDLSEVKTKSYEFRDLFCESINVGQEIVRCADCEHYEPRAKDGVCNRSKFIQMYAKADGFCSYGERKVDA